MYETRFSSLVSIFVISLLVLGIDSCETTVPESDDSPPELNLFTNGSIDVTITSRETERLPENPDLNVIASAKDEEGVKSVKLRVSKLVQCHDEDRPLPTRGEVVDVEDPKKEAPGSVGVGDETKNQRVAYFEINTEDIQADCGDQSGGVRFEFRGFAENFHEGRTESPTLVLLSPGYRTR